MARQLTSTPGPKRSAQFTPDSKEVFYLDRGRVFNVTLERREPKAIAVTAELDVDFSREKVEVFQQAWTYLRDQFFDEKMNGVDWNAVRAAYQPRIAGVAHARRDAPDHLADAWRAERVAHGYLGAGAGAADDARPARARFRPRRVRAQRPAARRRRRRAGAGGARPRIKPGDYLLRSMDVRSGARYRRSRRCRISTSCWITRSASGSRCRWRRQPTAAAREVVVKPTDQATEKALRYRQWVEQKRDYVAKASGGRLGYVHMFDMSAGALRSSPRSRRRQPRARRRRHRRAEQQRRLRQRLCHRRVLRGAATSTWLPRGLPSVSSRTLLGQRALELPTILVTNQHSLSDAEDFTEGYRR